MAQFARLTAEVNAYLKEQDGHAHKPMDTPETAMGFVRVANEAMCRPIRALTQVRSLYAYNYTGLYGAHIMWVLISGITNRYIQLIVANEP